MFGSFDFDVILRSVGYLFREGMTFTLMLTLIAALGGGVLGTTLAIARLSSSRVIAGLATLYINFMRSVPLLLVIFWFYFLMPLALSSITGARRPLEIGPFWSAAITFTLFEAAYFAEIVRAGIQSVPSGQTGAALALGLTPRQVMSNVVLPQAFRNMLPILLTQTIILFQDTSLVYVLSVTDFLGAATKIGQRDGRLVEMYVFAAVVYGLICYLLSLAVRRLQGRVAIIR